MEETKKRKWRFGKYRWIVLFLIVANAVLSFVFFPPIQPHIQLAPENVSHEPILSLPVVGDVYLTNTMIAMLIVDILVIIVALLVRNSVKRSEKEKNLSPKGIVVVIEPLMDYLYSMTESTAGKWAKDIFPFFFCITFVVLLANWMELIPGVDSIGVLHHSEEGNPIAQVLPGIYNILKGEVAEGEGYGVIPYVRVLSTDLNFTLALALISVVMIQVMGVRAQGVKYFTKFWNTKTFFSKPMFGLIDWAVGLLEVISEFSKILSFAFRLLGNIFAGSVMLFVIGSLVPIIAQSAFLGLEFFIGAIQALVFGMLTMIFMAQATMGHGDHENHAEEAL